MEKTIQSWINRFKVGLEDSEWGTQIQIGLRRFRVGLEDSEWGKKVQSGLLRGQEVHHHKHVFKAQNI